MYHINLDFTLLKYEDVSKLNNTDNILDDLLPKDDKFEIKSMV